MNTTHLHLLLNHFPIIGTLIGSGLLLWGILRKQNNLKSAGAAVLFVMAVIAIPVYTTGEPAEESVENLPGVSDAMIELHESAATIAIWLLGITGFLSLAALVMDFRKKTAAGFIFIVSFVLSVISFAAMARTGYYGGQIRHTEIANPAAASSTNENGNETKGGEQQKGKDDDD
jgi:uncharacterized membrane protein